MDAMEVSKICKALADPNRILIVKSLSNGELCACRLLEQFEIAQPTLSHHMKVLMDVSLVNQRKEGKWHYYSLNCEKLREFQDCLGKLQCKKKTSCCK